MNPGHGQRLVIALVKDLDDCQDHCKLFISCLHMYVLAVNVA